MHLLLRVSQLLFLLLPSFSMAAALEEDPSYRPETFSEQRGFFIEYFNYEDYVYSRSRKTELGDKAEVDVGLRYQFNENTFGRVRFETDPAENRFDNRTSKFELLGGHTIGSLFFQIDSEINTDDEDSGGISIGLDLDSELTLISYTWQDQFEFRFYPFNFDGEVGREFNTWDVTRVYFVDGAPSSVPVTPTEDEKVASKTIPGLEFAFLGHGVFESRFYVGVGAVSYNYPTNPDFDIRNQTAADSWQRKEDIGYKAGASFKGTDFRLELKYVGHTQAAETGALLEEAASFYNIVRASNFLFENEVAYSKAGSRPYRLSREDPWFETTTPWQPIYSNEYDEIQGWVGKSDFAYSLRVGLESEGFVPYFAYKYQGKNFIFRERESAHRLRTGDEALSHGGLNRYGFGAFFYKGNFVFNPEFEWLQAKNPVFTSSADLREDRSLASFQKDDFLLFLTVSYDFGDSKLFRP